MKHLFCTVKQNVSVSDGMRELTFSWPDTASAPLPGQFLTIRSTSGTDPLLRRPFAFSSFDEKTGTGCIIFQKRGRATELLSALEPGNLLDAVGPLGNTFPRPAAERLPVLVAGGVGLGPVLFLAEKLSQEGRELVVILGGRTSGALPSEAFLQRIGDSGLRKILCTDDGSRGFHGTARDGLLSIPETDLERAEIYACGPTPMMKAVSLTAGDWKIPCHVSMEQVMACAVGACMGCVIRVRGETPYARVCKEGPVFDAESIVWE